MLLTFGALPLSCLCTLFFFGIHRASVPFHRAIESAEKRLQAEQVLPALVHAVVAVCWALYALYLDPARAEGAGDAGPFAVSGLVGCALSTARSPPFCPQMDTSPSSDADIRGPR